MYIRVGRFSRFFCFKLIGEVGLVAVNNFKPSTREKKKSTKDFFRAVISAKNPTLVESKKKHHQNLIGDSSKEQHWLTDQKSKEY